MSNEATNGLAPSIFYIFQAYLERILAFSANERRRPNEEITGSDSRRAPEVWCFRTATVQVPIPTQRLILLSNTPQTKWCFSGRPHPIFVPWSPSSFGVDDVVYSCAEQSKKSGFSNTIQPWSSSFRRIVQAHANTSVEACSTLTLVLATG